ncbi:hypothetical protein AMAG_13146 [Allomyces macrogynus ATCC 38327]|uniref:Glucose-methanol-choline oxidoreductase N-terminal domain-containing protein n=1 Tax=Allomyces macrogynus (strain ATCC 38327) TaxID=578462 RepID=A0A0L0SZM5_ALLM3|nr:hypothetical protein AMAG_13146 [Allomyces macrogynus ATCC 38327]|eukprot:KNE67968.1 hypothetical protein AMAG_13146 [Allomyces macrogynus ATCC 38327]
MLLADLLAKPNGTRLLSGGKFKMSRKPQNRAVFFLFKSLADFLVYGSNRVPAQLNAMLGYPGSDPDHPKSLPPDTIPQFRFIDIPVSTGTLATPLTMKFDVVIVVSGAGGGVTAATLAHDGLHVVTLYDRGGMNASEDASIAVIAGKTLGGGTTGSKKTIDAVCDRLCIGTAEIKHNKSKTILFDGCKKLGLYVEDFPQNARNQPHECGDCGFGCTRAMKQSSALTWLGDATADGVQIIQSCHVEKALPSKDKKTARSVQDIVGPHKIPLIIEAPTVVLGLLPACMAVGYYPEETRPLRWNGPVASKQQLAKIIYAACVIVITCDRDRNARIVLDEGGSPVIQFVLSPFDGASAAEDLARAAQILIATGAQRIVTGQLNVPAFEPPSTNVGDPKTVAFLEKVRAKGVRSLHTTLLSAHQMGSARMSMSLARDVTTPRGQVRGVQGLYIADASSFPKSSGVNPMITTYSVTYSVANWIVEDIQSKSKIDSAIHV